MVLVKHVFLTLLLVCLSACSTDAVKQDVSTDEPRVGMVVTANPHATKAGIEVLRAGGSAVDAAIAIESVLSLVEPQSSGLGGGGFMMHFENATNTLSVYDGRETAPANVTEKMFLDAQGKSIGFLNAKNSGLSTGVPGLVSMFQLAHSDHGKLPWGVHFDRARQLAVEGFAVSPRLQGMISRFGKYIPKSLDEGTLDAFNYFFDEQGNPIAVGTVLTNADYAKTLEVIAEDPRAFYQGQIAQDIVEQVQQPPRAGSLSMEDMSNYQATKKTPLCIWVDSKQLCGPPPPSSWVAVGAINGLLDNAPEFSDGGADDPLNWAIFAEAQRLAYADRDHYVADNEFVEVPLKGFLSEDYLQHRAASISVDGPKKEISAGDPWAYQGAGIQARGQDATNDVAGTTHFVVVDGDGNVVSMTASVESIFGSTRMAGGMFLNNQLTDFSFKPVDDQGQKIANRVQPNKRPRSSMSPTIVLDEDGEFLMATGSPGGNSIIAYTAKTLVGVFDWGLSVQEAVNLPNMVARGNGQIRLEKDRAPQGLIEGLRRYGYQVKESAGENSGISAVVRLPDGRLQGGVDPRREGTIEQIIF